MSVTIWLRLELAWLEAKCKGKTLLVMEIFFTLHRYCTARVQYWCSVSKAKRDQVFSVVLLNGRKIQISLQLPDHDFTWRVAIGLYINVGLIVHYFHNPFVSHMSPTRDCWHFFFENFWQRRFLFFSISVLLLMLQSKLYIPRIIKT